jgi:hypothetical protein
VQIEVNTYVLKELVLEEGAEWCDGVREECCEVLGF